MKVAVIGGGWAGIAAAVELTASGIATTLFEAGRVLGGRARSITVAGQALDNGQHILLGAYRDCLALMRRVGADPEQLLSRHPLRIIDNDGFGLALPHLPTPFNLAWGLLTARGISPGEKLQTALWMESLKKHYFRLAKDSTVSAWLDAAGQTGKLRHHLWEPLCLAALNTPAERASAQLFANVLRDSLGSTRRQDTDLLLPRAPLGALLPEPAAHWLAAKGACLRLGNRVTRLSPLADAIDVDGERFTAAILATAPQHAARLCSGLAVGNYDYEPIATVYLQFSPGTALAFPLINLIGHFGQWVVDRSQGLLACILSGHGDWEKLSDDALARTLQEELKTRETPLWHKIIREKRATFSARPGLLRAASDTAHRSLFLAGDHTWSDYPATLEGAVRSGRHAARRLITTRT
ncbi:MAG: FAD-binding protein [Proteobacteria bacterium]|nr:FAD-binding protein [Pseudomonadota bacterium]